MNFEKALKKLRSGEQVKQECFSGTTTKYVTLDKKSGHIVRHLKNGETKNARFSGEALLAEDWLVNKAVKAKPGKKAVAKNKKK